MEIPQTGKCLSHHHEDLVRVNLLGTVVYACNSCVEETET